MTLTELGTTFKTDKVSHKFTDLYENHFSHLRDASIRLMEVGVYQGHSLQMWASYFSKGQIYGVDNCTLITAEQMKKLSQGSIRTIIADQSDRKQLQKVVDETGTLDIIVDDGLHYQEHQQVSLGFLFPWVKPGGVYVIEDLCPRIYPNDGWGIKDLQSFSDITTNVLENFRATGKMVSPYMKPDEAAFLEYAIAGIEIYYINKDSIIAFVWKKP